MSKRIISIALGLSLVTVSAYYLSQNRLGQKETVGFVRDTHALPYFAETCGKVKLLMTGKDGAPAEAYFVNIKKAEEHIHRRTTEFYYVLSGSGFLKLDGKPYKLSPGTAAYIPPGVWHQGMEGKYGLKVLVMCVPNELVPFEGVAKTYSLEHETTATPNVLRERAIKEPTVVKNLYRSNFYYVLAGQGILRYRSVTLKVKEGNAIYIPMGTEHELMPAYPKTLKLLSLSVESNDPTPGVMADIFLKKGGKGGIIANK